MSTSLGSHIPIPSSWPLPDHLPVPPSLPSFPPLKARPSLEALEKAARHIEDEYVSALKAEENAQTALNVYEQTQEAEMLKKREKRDRLVGVDRPLSPRRSDDSEFTWFSNRSETDPDPQRVPYAAKLRTDLTEAKEKLATKKTVHNVTQDALLKKRTSGEFYLSCLRDDKLDDLQQKDLFDFSEKKTNHYERQLEDRSLDSTVTHRHKSPWHEIRSRLAQRFSKEESRGRSSKPRSTSKTRGALAMLGIGRGRSGSRAPKPEQKDS